MPNSNSHFMFYAGLHFKTCPIEIREAWNAVTHPETVQDCIYKVTKQNLEFVNIGTCNRFDICIFGKVTRSQVLEIFYQLALPNFNKYNLTHLIEHPEKISNYLQIYTDANALKHLFKITASLDSLVVGEQQILGQIKSAFKKCSELGFARKNAHKIFTQNFRVAKKIRNETDIGKNSVSVGHAVIDTTHQVFESLHAKKILIIGAGSMAKIIAKNFFCHGVKSLYIANRTFEKAELLANDLQFAIPQKLIETLEQIHQYDICVVAASGNEIIITNETLKNFKKKRQGNLTIFIDVSVPRKIASDVNDIDNTFVFYIDDLDKIMEQNRSLRQQSAKQAEHIIEEEVQNYIHLCKQKENLLHVAKMHRWLKKTITYEVERYLYNSSRGKNILPNVVADAVAKRIVSYSAQLSRLNTKLETPPQTVGEMLEFLFKLSEQEELEFTKNKPIENVIQLKQKKAR